MTNVGLPNWKKAFVAFALSGVAAGAPAQERSLPGGLPSQFWDAVLISVTLKFIELY